MREEKEKLGNKYPIYKITLTLQIEVYSEQVLLEQECQTQNNVPKSWLWANALRLTIVSSKHF
jgi:hypothetical protein